MYDFDIWKKYIYINVVFFGDRSLDPAVSPPYLQTCHSPIPIFNYIEKLRIDGESNSLDDDLEDINNLIEEQVGVQNLPQNEFDNNQLMVQFQQDMANKIKVCFYLLLCVYYL